MPVIEIQQRILRSATVPVGNNEASSLLRVCGRQPSNLLWWNLLGLPLWQADDEGPCSQLTWELFVLSWTLFMTRMSGGSIDAMEQDAARGWGRPQQRWMGRAAMDCRGCTAAILLVVLCALIYFRRFRADNTLHRLGIDDTVTYSWRHFSVLLHEILCSKLPYCSLTLPYWFILVPTDLF